VILGMLPDRHFYATLQRREPAARPLLERSYANRSTIGAIE